MKRLITYIILTFALITNAFANEGDPFTKSLGEGVFITQETKNKNNDKTKAAPGSQSSTSAPVQQSSVTNTASAPTKLDPIGNILAPDPLIAYKLTEYTLKGTALNSTQSMNGVSFNREGSAQKIDYGNIKTTHMVNQNDTIQSIAKKYGYTEEELKIANSIVPGSKLVMGTRVTLPARVHKVQKGQTLEMIAEIYNLDLKDLVGFNNLMPGDELKLGENLLLPFYVYRTQGKETLEQVAKKFNRTKEEVSRINNLSSEVHLNSEQYVKIPIFINPILNVDMMKTKRGVVNYTINPKNLAIVEIKGQQYMVKEGDRLGVNDGKIVKITSTGMKVLENYEEFSFQINAPIVKQMASIPQSSMPSVPQGSVPMVPGSGPAPTNPESSGSAAPSAQGASAENSITNVEDLFR